MQIAIVDDSKSSLESLARLVNEMIDCSCVGFSDPRQGLAWCIANLPDAILVDYHMPDLDGLQFIAEYRGAPERGEVPIVMITTEMQQEIKRQALLLGATDFLSKPVDPIELQARLRNLLKLRRAHLALSHRAEWLAGEIRAAQQKIMDREREAILVLSRAAEHRDPETGQHLIRMAAYTRLIAEALGLAQDRVDILYAAAPMHDVGKIATPDSILLKPGKLTPDETVIMREHTVHGHHILAGNASEILIVAAEVALRHHERYDGAGYPNRLSGDAIPLSGRIVAVADVFDALTSARPYKAAWSLNKARTYLTENRGAHFDPLCVDAFLSRWKEIVQVATLHAEGEGVRTRPER